MTRPPRRVELLKWFQDHARPLAPGYEGALRLLDDGSFPGRIHFIAHAVRDIADRLPFVLDPQLPSKRVAYEDELDRIEKRWAGTHILDGEVEPETIPVDYQLAAMIDGLIHSHRERRQRPSNSALLFRILMSNEPNQATRNERLVSEFKRVHKWFMKWAHLRNTVAPPVDEDELQAQFRKFEVMLHSFVGSFFTGTKEIDEILREANQ